MKSRPIIFNAPMVRAVLDGSKTQTRRVVKNLPISSDDMVGFYSPDDDDDYWTAMDGGTNIVWRKRCPYGQPGDELWVRESWEWNGDLPVFEQIRSGKVWYKADPKSTNPSIRWRPSIHMPRWASRITLEVVSVRVERLKDISEQDALAEGVDMQQRIEMYFAPGIECVTVIMKPRTALEAYAALWESIHGAGSWEANPWAWVLEFARKMP